MSSFSEQLNRLSSPGASGSDTRSSNTPDAWRARLELDESGGFFVSTPRTAGELPDAVNLLSDFDLDADLWRVVSVRRSRWQRYDGEWLEAARVSVVPAQTYQSQSDSDIESLCDEIRRWRPSARQKQASGALSAVYAIGDTQYGKDSGDGSSGTVRRVQNAIEQSVIRHRELLKSGRAIGTIVMPQLGDCVEGSASQSGKVLGRSDLNVTQQTRVARRLLLAWIKALAPLAENVIVPAVPGNHDEPHRVVITDSADSLQIEIVSAVQDACAENDALAHVQFRYPERDADSLALNLDGVVLGMIHGHQTRNVEKWLQEQATGRTPVGDSDVLLSAHFHHFIAQQVGPRLHIQVPAMDGGSPWFRNRRGLESPSGIVSLVIGDGYDARRDLCVLAGESR
jgi:predicted phosphodiesterase